MKALFVLLLVSLSLAATTAAADPSLVFVSTYFKSATSAQSAPVYDIPVRIYDESGAQVAAVSIRQEPGWTTIRLEKGKYRTCWQAPYGFRSGCQADEITTGMAGIDVNLRDSLEGTYVLGWLSCHDAKLALFDDQGRKLHEQRALGNPRVFTHFVFGGLQDGDYVIRASHDSRHEEVNVTIAGGRAIEDLHIPFGCD